MGSPLRATAFLLVAATLGVFTARLSAPSALAVNAVATLFVVGLVWLGAALVLVMRYARTPGAPLATLALWLAGSGWLLEGVLPGMGMARAAGGAVLLQLTLDKRTRWAALGYLVTLALWFVSPAVAEAAPLVAAAVCAHVSHQRAPGFTRRRQAAWLDAGLTIAALGVVVSPWLPTGAVALMSLGVPVAVVAAIAKYRLLDADAFVTGAVVDLLLAAPLAAALLWMRLVIEPDVWLLAAMAFVLGATWLGARTMVHTRMAVGPLARVERLAGEIRRAEHLSHALGRLCTSLRELLELREARYLLHEGDGRLRVFSEGGSGGVVRLRAQGRLLTYAGAFNAPVFAEDLRAEPLDDAEEALLGDVAGGTELLVPCVAGDALAGLIQIAPRADESPIDPRAYRALAHLGARLGDLVDPLWWLDRQTGHLRAERSLVEAARALTLATAARDVARRLRPTLEYMRTCADGDERAADILSELELLTTDLVVAEAPGGREVFEVATWLDETADLLLPEAEIHLVALQVESDEIRLDGDADHLRLALRLLFGNALQTLADWPGPRQIVLSARTDGDVVRLGVSDSGPPRAPATDHPWSDPRGLRAATAERVARQHGGRLELSSATDGLAATLVLPAARLSPAPTGR